jgi:DNA-binding GntR family transcriptional regulator
LKLEKADSLRQQVYNLLKEHIINKRFATGDILNERKLSEDFGISRTPIREALKSLEHEGWVEYVPYKGAVVKNVEIKDIEDIFLIRNALETLAVELAIKNISDEYVAELTDILNTQKIFLSSKKQKMADFISLDREFHNKIAELTHSEILISMLKGISDKVKSLGVSALFSFDARFEETTTEHEAILHAIMARDVEEAKKCMKYHIDMTYFNANRYLKQKQAE